jgi:Domain of unknown function (DUF4395)
MTLSSSARNLLEMQGYTGYGDAYLSEVNLWTRWSPFLCACFIALGTALASPVILGLLAATAIIGALLPVHPFDLIYNYGVRHLTGTRPLPQNNGGRRFACALASVWLVVTAAAFLAGAEIVGYVLGFSLLGAASVLVLTGFCIPSFIFGLLFGRAAACQTSLGVGLPSQPPPN